jgi:acyl-[acyl-carrier-protein]-phospholipid O-acyltransferase / long-chain-fatty-acid--[acyl-carrier-protein] ligase
MNLLSKIIEVAEKFPSRNAVIDTATGKTYSYSRLLTASFLFADILKKEDDEFIGIMMPVTAGACITFLAVLITGKVPVMINYSTGAENNIKMAKRKCRFKTIVTSKKLCEKLSIPHYDGMMYAEDIVSSVGLFSKLNAFVKSSFPNFFSQPKTASDIAVLLFTTGSEKEPKAVMLTHDNILSNVESLSKVFYFDENDIFTGVLPLFHIYGLTTSFFLPLLSGSAINTYPNPLDYKSVADGIKRNGCTIITATPTFLRGYCQKSEPGDFKTLRIIMGGGDKLTKHIKDMYMTKHGVHVLEGYGTTETSPVISVNTFDNNKFGSIGRPLPDVQVKIIDIDTEQTLPAGQEGKIYVKGRLVMKGYYDEIEETSLRIRNGWYDTGDIGLIDKDGYLWHKGRLRRFVKIGGEMVSLTAVENAVEKYIGEEKQCCAIEIPHVSRGAEIIVAVTAQIDENDIRKKLSQELPPISLPKKFIYFEELPLMGNGKVNFRAVEEMCRETVQS